MTEILEHMGVREIELPLIYPHEATTVAYGKRSLNWKGRAKYHFIVKRARRTLEDFYERALAEKECYYGPFKGEFGHFLLHNLPFLVHLHQCGVRIHYCGMDLHKPFLFDAEGRSIIDTWYPLRDFFTEVKPLTNETAPPIDVQAEIDSFKSIALSSGKPFLDISDTELYWFVFRNWQLEGRQGIYDLSQVYASAKTNSCVIFPRKKGGTVSPNNGSAWDYMAVARSLSPFFEKVYLVGHPSLSAEVYSEGNIELKISAENTTTMKYCSEARLIVTQHSGAVHIGAYAKTPVLIIFNGSPPIKGLIDTIRFRANLTEQPLNYAFDLNEIKNFAARLHS